MFSIEIFEGTYLFLISSLCEQQGRAAPRGLHYHPALAFAHVGVLLEGKPQRVDIEGNGLVIIAHDKRDIGNLLRHFGITKPEGAAVMLHGCNRDI